MIIELKFLIIIANCDTRLGGRSKVVMVLLPRGHVIIPRDILVVINASGGCYWHLVMKLRKCC